MPPKRVVHGRFGECVEVEPVAGGGVAITICSACVSMRAIVEAGDVAFLFDALTHAPATEAAE